MIIRVASPKVASPSNDFVRFELQWITLNRAQALGLSLVFWIWHRGLFAAWAPRVMAASMIQNGVVIPCHSSSFPARIPMAPCFPTFHTESWKQRLRDPTVFVGSLQRIWLPFAPRNVISAFIRLRSGKRQRLAVALLIMSLLRYIRLVHLRLNAAARGFRSSELNSLEMVWLRSATQHPCQFRIWITHSS